MKAFLITFRLYILLLLYYSMYESIYIVTYWYSTKVKTNNTTCLYIEVVDLGPIDFLNLEDYGSIMARNCKITVCRSLLERLEVDGYICHVHISNIKNLLIICSFPHCTLQNL
jgi:hypothetical protein